MWGELKRQLLMGRKYIVVSFAFLIGLPLIFAGIEMLYFLNSGRNETISGLYLVVWIFTMIVCGFTWSTEKIGNAFVSAVRMSATRKEYMISYMILGMMVVFLMFQTGNLHIVLITKFLNISSDLTFIDIQSSIFLTILIMGLGFWFGAITSRYGWKSFYIAGSLFVLPAFIGTLEIMPEDVYGQRTLVAKFMQWIIQDIPAGSTGTEQRSILLNFFEFVVQDDLTGKIQFDTSRTLIIFLVLMAVFLIHGYFLLRKYTVKN